MSRRTSESSKAIRHAWENEQKLVLDGKGTRDWTPEQQRSIIEKGKAYDDNGKAFEGHHMKSAEAYPEFQSYPDNIEFLTRGEHKNAHGGSFQNPTNGYYDPIAQEITTFGDDTYTPCKIIELSSPIQKQTADAVIQNCSDADPSKVENCEPQPKLGMSRNEDTPRNVNSKKTVGEIPKNSTQRNPIQRFGQVVKKAGSKVLDYVEKHPALAMTVFVSACAFVKAASNQSSNTSSAGDGNKSFQDEFSYDTTAPDTEDSTSTPGTADGYEENSRGYPDERSSPREHIVPGHRQRYNTKNGAIWKEKMPYRRGGKSDDD